MDRNTARSLRRITGMAVMVLSVLACGLPGVGQTPPAAEATDQSTAVPTAAAATAAPTFTSPPPTSPPQATATPLPDVIYGGVSFSFDKSIVASVNEQTIAAENAGPDAAPWMSQPEHIRFDFNGYALSGTFHEPRLYIYPVEAYAALSPAAGEIAAELRQFLEQKPAAPQSIPFLPLWNAGQMLRANIRYLDFQSGSGVRFLSQYGQAVYAINNHSLFYTFQGLTSDNRYYVAAVLPVMHPSLPADESYIPGGDMDAFWNNFESYVNEVQQQLAAQPDASFTPDLSKLDAMMQSLKIE